MGKRSRRIDPAARDYVPDGRGGYEVTNTAEPAVYLQMVLARGSWVGAPRRGSRLSAFVRAKSIANRTPGEIREAIRETLQPLVDEGRLRDLQVRIARDRDRVVAEIIAVDVASGARMDLTHLLPSRS